MSWLSAYDWLYNLLNSNFSSALFGAGFGAWAASWIAVRTERRKILREEIGLVNTAIGFAAGIVETTLIMRSQYVIPMGVAYLSRFHEFVAVERGLRPLPAGGKNTMMADMRFVHPPTMPIAELKALLQSPMSTSAYGRALVGCLAQSVEALLVMIHLRNAIVQTFPTMNDETKTNIYFGLRSIEGFIDERYPDCMEGMNSNSEDVAYFSELLIEILMAHGEKLAAQYGRDSPRIVTIDLSQARADGRLANRAQYPSFENQFRKPLGDLRKRRWI